MHIVGHMIICAKASYRTELEKECRKPVFGVFRKLLVPVDNTEQAEQVKLESTERVQEGQ